MWDLAGGGQLQTERIPGRACAAAMGVAYTVATEVDLMSRLALW